ncbi:MAG: PDZ domain-containing protein [Chthonomonadales bacterium]
MRKLILWLAVVQLSIGVSGIAFAQIKPTPPSATGIDIHDTRLLSLPAISKDHIAFIYAGDLWTTDLDGKNSRRLTAGQSIPVSPIFSPDGSTIAFSGQYDGNLDVFVVPVTGGSPRRLTWHPGPDIAMDFTPDGNSVLFVSQRASFSNRYTQLFTVPVKGGVEEQLNLPNAFKAAYSPDGKMIAYTPLSESFKEWKRYRGGSVSTLNICKLNDYSVEKIPQPATRCNDTDPMWIGEKVYFRSDRTGEFNLFSYDLRTHSVKQLTTHTDFPVLSARAGGGQIIYEQSGYLHKFDPQTGKSAKLTVGVAADLPEIRPRYATGMKWLRGASLSPTGARVAVGFRGEIVTVPVEKGSPRNITNTPGAHERSPIWSPDGKNIAYFSDESGEYELVIRSQDGKGTPNHIKLSGAGFYEHSSWSPDSKKIAYTDNSRTFYYVDVASGVSQKVGSDTIYSPIPTTNGARWSSDSHWLTYELNGRASIRRVYVYNLQNSRSYPISDGLSDAYSPAFDESGKYLYFLASTDAGPVRDWFAQSSIDMRSTSAIYMVVLRKDLSSPLAPESDEEKAGGGVVAAKPGEAPVETRIDFDEINNRTLALPLPKADYQDLQTGSEGQVYYLKAAPTAGPYDANPAGSTLNLFDLGKRKNDILIALADGYDLSVDHKKLIYGSAGSMFVVAAGGKPAPGDGRVALEAIEVRIDPGAEWSEIFDDAWRINRDYFYAPNMHGLDWPAIRAKYAQFLPHLSSRNDLNRVMQWMFSELSVGHHGVGGGDQLIERKVVSGGLLGADYVVENGRYRFKKIYGGLNWTPSLRSPLTEPGVNARAGEYLLAIKGKDLRAPENVYAAFENSAGHVVEITLGPNPDGTGSRTVNVVPIASEAGLRNRDWVEGNLKKVDQATGGRVAYVYVPDTANDGHEYFKRYFYPQANKEAVIIDERFNGGGDLADYYLETMRRVHYADWHMRYGEELSTPLNVMGPKVMIIDETAGSGGDFLPWMFRNLKLGKIIGKRTWGGLVGILGFPTLMDGGSVTAPNVGIWTEDGWVVENVGVPPDIEVEQTPADVINGHDPQLEKAIQVALDELKKNPPKTRTRPAFPVKK